MSVMLITPAAQAEKAVATIYSITQDSAPLGEVVFEETDEGLEIKGRLAGVPPGKHGIHVHNNGSCLDGGKAAGGHYNPEETKHGFLPLDGFEASHVGDLGNIDINNDGAGRLDILIFEDMGVSNSIYNVAGRAVILHEKEDDFGQPTGNAGSRIGCGIIQIVGE